MQVFRVSWPELPTPITCKSGGFDKKAQKNLEIRTSNLETIPANFFWDFWRRFRRSPMNSEAFRRIPKSSENVRSSSPSINASSLPVLFTSNIRDREEGIVIYSLYTWFSFLIWVWVNIFLDIVSSKTATTNIFQSGVRNWPVGVSRCEIEVFNLQAWDKAWELASIGDFKYASIKKNNDRLFV